MVYTENPKLPEDLKIGDGRSKIYYKVPELDNRIIFANVMGKELSQIGMTCQDWYDRHALGIESRSDRPKCPYCEKDRAFNTITSGYRPTCGDKDCKSKEYTRVQNESRKNNPDRWKKQCDTIGKPFNEIKEKWREVKDTGITYYEFLKNFWNEWRERNERMSKDEYKRTRHENKEERIRLRKEKEKECSEEDNKLKGSTCLYKGLQSKIFSKFDNRTVSFDSSWERSYFLMIMSKIDELGVISIRRTKVASIGYHTDDGRYHRYYPDFLVEYNDGRKEIIEIKPKLLTSEAVNSIKAIAAEKFCSENGLVYKILTEIELIELGVLDERCHPLYE